MSIAERLRKAAETERQEWGDSDSRRVFPRATAIHLALADLLEQIADSYEDTVSQDWDPRHRWIEPYLAIADVINGGAS